MPSYPGNEPLRAALNRFHLLNDAWLFAWVIEVGARVVYYVHRVDHVALVLTNGLGWGLLC